MAGMSDSSEDYLSCEEEPDSCINLDATALLDDCHVSDAADATENTPLIGSSYGPDQIAGQPLHSTPLGRNKISASTSSISLHFLI